MSWRPSVKLSVLRDVGWSQWDPIELDGSEGGWQRSEAADEYDRFMMRVAGDLQGGEPDEDLVHYLVNIETRHMGLTETPRARTRAAATVAAIREYVDSLT